MTGTVNPDTGAVIREISRYTGINGKYYNEAYLLRRISYRVERCGMKDLGEYIEYLRKNAAESRRLVDSIGVNVTAFFRDPDVYEVIGRWVLPQLIERKRGSPGSRLRIWSTCCATGEEPYSLAIILRELLNEDERLHNVAVHATDIDDEAVRTAVKGRYSAEKIAVLSDVLKRRYFAALPGEKTYEVQTEVKRLVRFRKHDLIGAPPFSMMDMVVCRNMLIYVKHDMQPLIYEKLCDALAPGGYLVLGKTETPPVAFLNRLETVDLAARIYRRK